jgi:glycosyltransferase involved in cell wall biosynthesis
MQHSRDVPFRLLTSGHNQEMMPSSAAAVEFAGPRQVRVAAVALPGLHRAGPGPPRRPRRPGRAPRRARPDGIARLYAGADVFVLPSRREPYGTVYGEALAACLPVVGWRAGNLPHLVSDGVEGVVLDPGDIPALAAALDRLASDELWRAAEALRCRDGATPRQHSSRPSRS